MQPFRRWRRLALILALAWPAPVASGAEGFDHYLLALTWMPSFCALEGDARDDDRCAPDNGHGWMVHGLWPQGTGGAWPEYCATPQHDPSRRETAAQRDLFGTGGAAWHQWNKHGRCTGLSAGDYYALTRAARDTLVLPEVFEALRDDVVVAPDVVEAAFIEANPALDPDMMITTCRSDLIVELRLCLTRGLEPRLCDPALLQRSCPLQAARLPGSRAAP